MEWTWAKELFIEKADLFLRVMNYRWEQAIEEAKWIVRILEANDIFEGKILDLMCGNGRIAVYLAERGYKVIGVDISPLYIRDANQRAKKMGVQDNVQFIVGDSRDIDQLVSKFAPFDAVLNIWSSLGYYGEKADLIMFKKARHVTRDGGIFIIADTISKESLLSEFAPHTYAEFPDLLILHFAEYDPLSSILTDLWRFYEKKGEDWIFLDSVRVKVRIYSLSEIAKMLEQAGWTIVQAYDSLIGLSPLKPNSRINIVARANRKTMK